MITSTKNPKVQWIRRLQGKSKERQSEGVIVLEGVRLLEEAFNSSWEVKYLIYTEELSSRGRDLVDECIKIRVQAELVSSNVMRAVSDTKNPQGVLAVVKMQTLPVPEQLDYVIILDQIREPGNLGAILRSAMAAGVQLVILTPGTVDPYSPKTLRAGMGAQLDLPVQVQAWDEVEMMVNDSKLTVYLADVGKGEVFHQCDFFQPLALIIGGEAEGASETAYKVADSLIHIPMSGGVESLNSSVSAGILLFEIVRQRGKSK